jgi:hypothetical protein
MMAIQDQVIATKNYRKFILKDSSLTNDLCRRCNDFPETIQHITSACGILAPIEYKHRHDSVAKIIHQELGKKYGFCTNAVPYYKYQPSAVLDNQAFTLYWDRTIYTARTVSNNRPDITLIDKAAKKVTLIDIAIVNTHNLESTHNHKISKYMNLQSEIKAQWQVDHVKIVPIVLSTTGVITNNLHVDIKDLDLDKHLYAKLQKSVIINTTSIVRGFLNHDA